MFFAVLGRAFDISVGLSRAIGDASGRFRTSAFSEVFVDFCGGRPTSPNIVETIPGVVRFCVHFLNVLYVQYFLLCDLLD